MEYCSIAADVVLGEDVRIYRFVNLYGCSIGDHSRIGSFVEIQKGADFHGAVFVDAEYRNEDLCGGDLDYDMNNNEPAIRWSQCAVDRSIVGSGLDEYSVSDGEGTAPLGSRAFFEIMQ